MFPTERLHLQDADITEDEIFDDDDDGDDLDDDDGPLWP